MAQQSVSGNVKTPGDMGGLAIETASVEILNTTLKTCTDEFGNYYFDNVQILSGKIKAQALGFKSQTQILRPVVDFELEPKREVKEEILKK